MMESGWTNERSNTLVLSVTILSVVIMIVESQRLLK